MPNQNDQPNTTKQAGSLLDNLGAGKLKGADSDVAFLFIHGFGTSPLDLLPLARAFHKRGYTCQLLCLRGHGKGYQELAQAKYEEWRKQVCDAYSQLHSKFSRVFLVGFSMGGMMAIDLAACIGSVAGVISISTFFKSARPRLATLVLFLASLMPKKRFRWRLHTTVPSSRKQLYGTTHLPAELSKSIFREAEGVQDRFGSVKCPVLLLHSVDDKVASYEHLAYAARINTNVNALVVTFFALDHFLQFDVPPAGICNLALEQFGLSNQQITPPQANSGLLVERLKQRSEESRHWAEMLFRLITGFFAVMGGLLYVSLPDVIGKQPRAPYYLISYSLLISIYVQLATLYFFYLNRVDSYIKYHIEPYLQGVGWISFRTNHWASGEASKVMTRLVSIAELGIPFIISYVILIYTAITYYERFLLFDPRNSIFLQTSLGVGTLFWIIAAYGIGMVMHYGRQRLHIPVITQIANEGVEEQIDRLYASISPGSVHQPGELVNVTSFREHA